MVMLHIKLKGMKHTITLTNVTRTPVSNQGPIQNMVMLHIKLKGMKHTITLTNVIRTPVSNQGPLLFVYVFIFLQENKWYCLHFLWSQALVDHNGSLSNYARLFPCLRQGVLY